MSLHLGDRTARGSSPPPLLFILLLLLIFESEETQQGVETISAIRELIITNKKKNNYEYKFINFFNEG